MSRFNGLNMRVISAITVLVVLGVGGIFFLGVSVVWASPASPLSAPASVQPSAGDALDEDSLSWGSGNSTTTPVAPSPIAVPAMPVEPVASSSLPVLEKPEVKLESVVSTENKVVDKETVEENLFDDDADIVEESSENTAEFLVRIEALEKNIKMLEKKVGKLQQDNEAAKKLRLKKASRAKKASKAKKAKRKVQTQRKSLPWGLRAASPGKAWVSEKGSNELRVVKQGETLEGIGKVNAIVKDSSGHWVVDGVSGRISQ